jgi:signal transduction histidine kinase
MLSELLAVEPLPSEAAGAQIAHIRDSAKRLTEMVDTLIAGAMNDALDIQIRREPIDLGALVSEVADAHHTLAQRKEQQIVLSRPKGLTVVGDQDRLAEAVDNLVSNAIKYSPKGAAIDVTVERRDGQASVAVRDQGPGLSREDMSRLFGRFQRLSAQPTGGETSTGLGLSIAKRIVELHGGTIEAQSEGQGRGAVFEILLPTERWVEP